VEGLRIVSRRQDTFARSIAPIRQRQEGGYVVVILLALLVVLMFAGIGFAIHVLWILAVVLLALWAIGLVIGKGERAGQHGFYRW
jgi:hypothetical protein